MSEENDNEDTGIGVHFGKRDLDRLGFFDDPQPSSWGPHAPTPGATLRSGQPSGVRQMTSGDLRGGYFDEQTRRIFEGECLPELGSKKKRGSKKQKKLGVVMPPGYTKWHSSPGDAFGCFAKHPKRFDPATRPGEKRVKMPANFMTRPNPVGGPGYADITLSPYPKHLGPDPYDPNLPKDLLKGTELYVYTFYPRPCFDENPYREVPGKKGPKDVKTSRKDRKIFHLHFPHGGKNNGCLSQYPVWMSDPFDAEPKKKKQKVKLSIWQPGVVPVTRTKFTASIIDKVTSFCCNETNFRTYTERVYKIY